MGKVPNAALGWLTGASLAHFVTGAATDALRDEAGMLELWIHKTWRAYRGKKRWAKLRVKNDIASGEDYFDILVGKNGEEAHAHIGIALDHTLLFTEYRGLVRKIGRKIESQQKGVLEDKDSIVNPNATSGQDLILKVNVDTRTGETTIIDFALKEDSD